MIFYSYFLKWIYTFQKDLSEIEIIKSAECYVKNFYTQFSKLKISVIKRGTKYYIEYRCNYLLLVD